MSHEIVILSLLIVAIVILWFTTLEAIKTKRLGIYTYFFLNFSVNCFGAAGLFTNFDIFQFFESIYILSFITGVLYLITMWRLNNARSS